jgi:MoaA/NifB/PqqE/SkfB family radical SAM enzyme
MRKKRERFPKMLSLELSSACNANCIMCPHGEMTRKKGNMSLETLNKIIKDCQGQPLKKINLFWFGDSFCNRNAVEYIRAARKGLPGVKLYISTNAGLLSKEISQTIIDEDLLDVINFDIDGIKKETYEGIRRNLNYEEVVENVEYFLRYKKEKGKTKPQTRVTIIKMVPTEGEIEEFIKKWKPLVDKVDVNDYNTWLGTQDDRNVGESRQRSLGGNFDFACLHPWDELVISAEGIAGLCCLDYDLKAVVGDISKESIKEIWQGEKMNNYRNKMLNLDYDSIDVCKTCNAYIYQENKSWAKLQK